MKKILSVITFLLMVVFIPPLFAEELILEFDPDEELNVQDLQEERSSPQSIPKTFVPVQQNGYLQGYQQLFQLSEGEVAGLEAVLIPLKEQISQIDTQLQMLQLQMQRMNQLNGLVQQKLLELRQLMDKLKIQEQLKALEMKEVTKKFEKMLALFFRIKQQFVKEDGSFDMVQLLSLSDSPADILLQDYLLQKLQRQMVETIGFLASEQRELQELSLSVEKVNQQILQYQERIQESQLVLAQQSSFQQQLILDKREEQVFFQEQLEEAREEQRIIYDRIREIATGVSIRDYQEFPVESFIWPVAPLLGISAHFQDVSYRQRFGIDHNAIDIPTDQLTPVKAPLSGKVLKVHDGGLGYSYLQLGHRDQLSTVYGHIYSLKVGEGDLVQQGQIIALSGGAIGTKGAGRLTTGPHLHFEVLKDGEFVDPLDYLPEINF